MYSYLTITDIEDDMDSIFKQIDRDIGAAGDNGIMAMMQDVSILAWHVDRFAVTTDEWTCFSACQECRNSLRVVYENLDARLMAN